MIGNRIETASRFVIKCDKLLDVGCGEGKLESLIRNRVNKIYGIDACDTKLLLARKRGIVCYNVDLDISKIPLDSSTIDIVTCLDVIEHVRNPIFVIKEIHRVLKKNGLFIITTPNIRFIDHIKTLVIKGKFPKTSMDKTVLDEGHLHYFTYKDINSLLISNKFTICATDSILNKPERGIKGKMAEKLFGKFIMQEFFSPGILFVARKL